MAQQGQCTADYASDGTLLVKLSGAWRLQGGLPSAESLVRELETLPGAGRMAFEAKELVAWDSSLLTFVERLMQVCRERRITADLEGLPMGLRRLMNLAEAVSGFGFVVVDSTVRRGGAAHRHAD
jgi:phospholipid/cholesterol/gamma-HCH transport system permease protein